MQDFYFFNRYLSYNNSLIEMDIACLTLCDRPGQPPRS
jgi:hypothetical protein